MARQRTRNALKRNAQGTARPFIAGLENARLTALDSLQWQAFTEVAGLNVEKTDNTTITLPSDTDGFQLDEVTTGYGGLQQQTSTLTEYMDERQNTSWIAGVKRDLPFSLWLPQGRGRQLSDAHDFTSGTLVDLVYLQSDNQDDNANPSDGDVANPNKVSVGISYHGRGRHTIRPAQFTLAAGTVPNGAAITAPAVGAAYIEGREDTGSISRRWFLLETGASGARPRIHERDIFGRWQAGANIGGTSNNDQVKGLYPVSGSLIAGGAAGVSHYYIDPDDVTSATEVADASFASAVSLPQDIYVRSNSEIFIVGGNRGVAGSKSLLVKVEDPTQAGDEIEAAGSGATGYFAIDGFGDQIVLAGGSAIGTSAGNLYGANAVIKVSNDGGDSFTTVTSPSGAKGVSAVYQTDVDTFWIGTGDGELWFTYNFGKSFQQVNPAVSLSTITGIEFLWPSGSEQASRVGYVTGTTGGTFSAKVLRTIDGGNTWRGDKSYVSQEIKGDTAHANERWFQIAVAGPQSVLIAGQQGGTVADLTAFVEYE